MQTVTRTIYGSALQTSQLLGLPYVIPANTTLNERFNIEATSVIPADVYPKLKFFSIGTGGVKLVAGAGGLPRTEQVQHRATDAACYAPLPFILRPAGNDLTALERTKYALRKQETHNGDSYIAYYLKRIDMTGVSVSLESRTITNGNTTSVPFVPGSSNLVPVPPVLPNAGANVVTSEYITCSAKLALNFTPQECQELLDVSTIIYGNEDYAIISEFGICSGEDKVIALPSGGGNFKEAIGVQVMSIINTYNAVLYSQGGINGLFDIGVNDVLLNLA